MNLLQMLYCAMKVFKKSGEEFLVIKDYKQVGTFMEVAYIDATVKSPYPIQFEIGDYVIFDYNGLKYSLYSIPSVKKQARSGSYNEAFIYEVKFKADTEQLAQCPLLDIVPSDNNIHFTSLPSFSTYENVYGIAARIQANIDYLFPSQWQIRVADTDNRELLDVLSDAREFSVSGASCLDACSKIYDVWGVSYIHTFEDGVNVITFGKSAGVTSPFRYGKGQGLRAFKRNIQNTDELCTRLYAYGSSRNLPARWYNDKGYISESQYAPNLMLPPSLWKDGKPQGAYIDAIIKTEAGDTILIDDRLERYGLNIKTFVYDGSDGREEIYPSIEKVTAKNIRDAKSDLAEKKYIPSLELYADTDRMDMVLEGSIVDDNGLTEGDSYKLYSDTIEIPTVNKVERDDHSITPSANGSYNIYNHTLSFTICSFNITEVAKYRIEQADRVLFFQRNDRYSKAVIEYRIQNPSGGNYVIYVDEFSDDMLVSKNFSIPKGLVFDAYTAGEYKLIADIRIEWPEDTTNLKPLSDLGFFFGYGNIYNKNIVIARGERLLSAYFDIKIKQIGFDINDYTASTGAIKSISFKSGMCAGRTFEITKCVYSESDDSWLLTCRRSDDSAVSQRFPNSIFPISQGDQFILLNINMPDLYIQTAMYRLYDKAYSDLKYYSKPQFLVEPEIDKLQIARSPQLLREGMYMPIDDFDLSFVEDILIDSVTITNKGTELRSFDVTLRNEKPLNRLSKINDRVSGLENSEAVNKKEASRTPAEEQLPAANIYDVSIRLNAVEQAVNDRFQLVTTSDGTQVLKTKYNLASDGEITAGGAGTGDDNPDVSATTLGGLLNVDDSADEVSNEDKVLVKKANETHWTLKDLAEIGGASGLDISELEKYLQNNSYITLDDVEDLDLVTADWVSGNYQPKGDYLTDDKLASKGYATEQWVKNQNYLDSVPDDYITQQELQSFAYITREDVSSMGYATEQWVKDQKYLTQHQDISHLLSKEEAGNTYATIGALNTTNQNLSTLRGEFDSLNSLLNDDTKGVINTWQEVKDFLDGYSESQDLATILFGMNADIASRAKQSDLTIVQNRVKTLEDLGLELRTLSDGTKVLLSIYNFASQGEVMSGGIADIGSGGSGGGLIQRVYGYDNITDVFDNSVKTDTFNAFTIAKIAERVSALENGGVDLTGYATESWVERQGYLNAIPEEYITDQELQSFAYITREDVSSMGFASEQWVTDSYQPKGNYLTSIPSEYVTETELSNKGYATTTALTNGLNGKVDKVTGKQLSTEDFTTALKTKLDGLNNYNDTAIQAAITTLRNDFNVLVDGDTTRAIETFNEIVAFLEGVDDTHNLAGILAAIEQQIAVKQDIITDLATIKAGAAKGATALQSSALNGYATQQWVTQQAYINEIGLDDIYNALGYVPFAVDDFTKASIKSTLGISDWALSVSKPSYAWSEITGKPSFATVATSGKYSDLSGLPTIPTYNFTGVSFTSGNSDQGNHNCNNITSNGHWYYRQDGPDASLGATSTEGALYTQAYGDMWVAQIAQDYRNGNLFTRGRKNGSWSAWKAVSYNGHTHTKSQITDFPSSLPASDVYSWAKASTKPSYNFSEIGNKPTTLAGYGITDFVVANKGDSINNYTKKTGIYRWSSRENSSTPDLAGYGNSLSLYASSDTWGQIYVPYLMHKASGIYWRGSTTSSNDVSWRKVLDDVNYTDYVYTKAEINTELADYLQLNGGTITTGDISGFSIYRNNSIYSAVHFFNTINGVKTDVGYLGVIGDGSPVYLNSGGTVYNIITSGNIASQSVAYASNASNAGNADTLGGINSDGFLKYTKVNYTTTISNAESISQTLSAGVTKVHISNVEYSSVLTGYDYDGKAWQLRFKPSYNDGFYFRSQGTGTDWKKVAFTDSNVASATKLATPRTIWGQSFDGTGDVSGAFRIVRNTGVSLADLSSTWNGDYDYLIHNNNNALAITVDGVNNARRAMLQVGHAATSYSEYLGHLLLNPFGGNVLIGTTTNNGNKLQVAGNISATSVIVDSIQLSNGQALSVYSDGTAYLSGNLVVEGEITSGGGGNAASVSEDIDMIMQLELRVAELERRLAQYE